MFIIYLVVEVNAIFILHLASNSLIVIKKIYLKIHDIIFDKIIKANKVVQAYIKTGRANRNNGKSKSVVNTKATISASKNKSCIHTNTSSKTSSL